MFLFPLNRSLGTLSFGQDTEGNWGYKVGASTEITPFKSTSVEDITLSYRLNTFSSTGQGYCELPVFGYSKCKISRSGGTANYYMSIYDKSGTRVYYAKPQENVEIDITDMSKITFIQADTSESFTNLTIQLIA